jgi:integrase
MIVMGRPKTVWVDLPPRMAARRLASKVLYYYQAAGEKIPLGADLNEARRKWAELEAGQGRVLHFPAVADLFTKAQSSGWSLSTKDHYQRALGNLSLAFGAFSLEQIEPRHVKEYIRKRSKKGAAIFEKRVLSAVYNWARGEGHTSSPNPCRDIKFSKAEKKVFQPAGQKQAVPEEVFWATYERGDDVLKDAMDLAHLSGQRPGDLLKARRTDIADGVWTVVQQKTGAVVKIKVEGELKQVLERILTRPRKVQSVYIISDKRGQRVLYSGLNRRHRQARGDVKWEFREIRAKTATDSDDLKSAQRLLGHANEQTTATVYRRSNGGAVSPLRRKSNGTTED